LLSDPNMDDQYGLLLKRIQVLEKQMEVVLHKNNTTKNVNNINNSFNNTVNLTLNLGSETFDHIPKELIYKCLLNKELDELMRALHFDERYPENHNIRHKNRDHLEYYKDTWLVGPRNDVLNKWLNGTAFRILKDVYLENNKKREIVDNTRWFLGLRDLKEFYTKDVKPKLSCTLVSNKIKKIKSQV